MIALILIIVVAVILGGIIGCGIFTAVTYNKLVERKNSVKNAWAQIDAQLQRKFDLIPNLVEAVKGFAEHEKQIIEDATLLMDEYGKAETSKEKIAMDTQLNSCLKSLYVAAENHPMLKSNVQFLQLQESLTEIEEDIGFARQFYNDAVTIYNNKLMSFPNNIIASIFNFKEEELFDAFNNDESNFRIHFKTKCHVCGAAIVPGSSVCQYCGASL